MLGFGSLAFLNPWLLLGLLALPILWWLLRAIPPSPRTQPFAGVRLLLGLTEDERETETTPWWLLLLRALAVAAALIGFAQPVLNPGERLTGGGDGPLLLAMDQGWASAPEWAARKAAAQAVLDEAREAGRPVMFWPLASGDVPPPADADAVRPQLDALQPAPWSPDRTALATAATAGALAATETVWLHDGLNSPEAAAALSAAAELGPLRLIGPAAPPPALTPPRLEEGRLVVDVLRAGGPAEDVRVVAIATEETGAERRVAVADAAFDDGEDRVTAEFDLPPELIRRVSRVVLADRASAGGAALATGAIKRVSVGIVAPGDEGAAISLTSPTHYLTKALEPHADVATGTLDAVLARRPAVVLMADQGALAEPDREALRGFVEDEGGLLIRFAGPRLAAAISARMGAGAMAAAYDPLLPVRLRRGGRVLGGALAWSSPRRLGTFADDGIFRRLDASREVEIRTQVLAEPGPELAGRVWATLEDGTPLVTGKELGAGRVVLFHVTADAEWSSLPLSGLFVEMLGRLMTLATGQGQGLPEPDALDGTLWRAETLIGADGAPRAATGPREAVAGERLAALRAGRDVGPGRYARADQGERLPGDPAELIVNLYTASDSLEPFPQAPSGAVTETLGGAEAQALGAWFLVFALLLAMADVVATLIVSGRLAVPIRGAAATVLIALLLPGATAEAQGEDRAALRRAIEATAETTLGFIVTGEPEIDRISERAMIGLGNALTARTAIEPGPPLGVDPEQDALPFFPVLYWPLRGDALPSDTALTRLSEYLANGGLLVIDTQNGASGFGSASATEMRRIAQALNLPPLAPVDGNHVLTRTFYLLDRFPGRWRGGQVWAEAPPPRQPGQAADEERPQFDRIDDNVSPVIVGSADWAAAWAVDSRGMPLVPVGRRGDRQRELATRFGVNLVMYALTGNYKSDQVHAPDVLRRLGQ